jgi:hypothetical protein
MLTSVPLPKTKAEFIQPMLLQRAERLPEGPNWLYELKLDGYQAIGVKPEGRVHLWSGNEKHFGPRYPSIIGSGNLLTTRSSMGRSSRLTMPASLPSPRCKTTTVPRRLRSSTTYSM